MEIINEVPLKSLQRLLHTIEYSICAAVGWALDGKRLSDLITIGRGGQSLLGTGSQSFRFPGATSLTSFCFRESVFVWLFGHAQVMKKFLLLFGWFLLIEVQGQRLAKRSCPDRPVVKHFDVAKVSAAAMKDVSRLLQYFR